MPEVIGLDFETYGAVSLPDHGLYRYTEDSTFRVLLACIKREGDPWALPPLEQREVFDFVADHDEAKDALIEAIGDNTIVAHNAGFERRVLETLGLKLPARRFIDSAVIARAAGAGGSLEAAAPQLLDADKLASGWDLIKLFSIPSKEQVESGSLEFDPRIVRDNPVKWEEFTTYCQLDAKLSLSLYRVFNYAISKSELDYQALTMEMNSQGWKVDVPTVQEMQRRYLENVEVTVEGFREKHDAHELNLNSLKQLKEWCADRGIKANSFDEKNVERLASRIDRKLDTMQPEDEKYAPYSEVLDLLRTKQVMGGSSLKKLQVILDTVGEDERLRDQYLHCGAGQTLRTTGRSVQMQNLKRLSDPEDMLTLMDPASEWDNTKLAENLRQVFTASDPQGQLIVGDFSSVESRGLAYLAGADWKLNEFRAGKDMYKVQSAKMYSIAYEAVTKQQRTPGKVAELSCGYGAGPGAVLEFAKGMGVEMTEGEATQLVYGWRDTNPEIVEFWKSLDLMLEAVMGGQTIVRHNLKDGLSLIVESALTPLSLQRQHQGATSLVVSIMHPQHGTILRRVFHGCYMRGRSICYYKPSARKTGDLWSPTFVNPKTKQVQHYSIYGGKLSGILTQSFCREIFFRVLSDVSIWVDHWPNVKIVGQFHDEIVLDWVPGPLKLKAAKIELEESMENNGIFKSFPLAADIKHDYRYTK